MNSVTLVGKIINKSLNYIIIRVGTEEEVDIPIYIPDNIYDNVEQHCDCDDIIGIRGKISRDFSGIYIKADKVSVLSN